MDGNMLASLMGTSSSRPESKAKKADKTDGDAFSACMDEASKTKGESNKEMLADESSKPSKDKDDTKEAKRKAAKKELEEQLKGLPGNRDARTSMQARRLMGVDQMNMAEKQALQLGEFSHEAKERAEVSKQAQAPMPGPLAYGAPPPGLQQQKAGGAAKPSPEAVEGKLEAQRTEQQRAEAAKDQKIEPTLEQKIANESKFTEELQKTGELNKNQERQAVIDQVLKHIEVRNFQNKTELHLRLNPEYLGELKVKLLHTDEGVSAQFITDSRTTREVLEENENELRTEAGKKGVRLGKMKVQLVDNLT